jgi:C4-dicarboxylate-specific signal transduction histidine kinase
VGAPIVRGANRAVLDARELARWGIPAGRVPSGVEVRFGEPSLWVRHRITLLLAVGALLFQSALIGLLLFERRRRWRAEARARESLAELAHMNRVFAFSEVVGSLAHEINSPLGAALNNAEAAQRLFAASPRDEAEVRACMQDIVGDITRAGDVLRRIRRILRNERFTPVALRVDGVVRDACRLVKAEARDRHAELDVLVAPDLPVVAGDEVQLAQVIVNLLLNALDAVRGLPEGRRQVWITAERAADGVAIRVADSGPGVPPDLAKTVFEPFYTTKETGLGMGLAITRSIVESHGGTISVAQRPGGGASFEVLLPAAPAAAGEPSAATG